MSLKPYHIYGINFLLKNNISFADEQRIVFPAGNNIVIQNKDTKAQNIIQCSEHSTGMTAVAYSPNRRYVAVAETLDKTTVCIYDLVLLRRKKMLVTAEMISTPVVCMAFSADSKYLAVQAGGTDWTIVYWLWEKAKVLSTLKPVMSKSSAEVSDISFNPEDNSQICISGLNTLKFYRYTEGILQLFSSHKLDSLNYTCHTWIDEDRIVAGTMDGKLVFIEAGEINHELKPFDSTSDSPITSICIYSKGMFFGYGSSLVVHYEKMKEKEYTFNTKIEIEIDELNIENHMSHQVFHSLAINSSEETLVCSTNMGQIYSFGLGTTTIDKKDSNHFENVGQFNHYEAVKGLDVCIRKSLVVTTGNDRTVAVRNYETDNLELVKEFSQEIHSISLHPSGLYILAGFTDKLRLMSLLIDDIKTVKEFMVKLCRECRFSHGGHVFAAANSNMIQIFSTITFHNVINLKGHNSRISSLKWGLDDLKLYSCGSDGAVYEWDLISGTRVNENVLKQCSYSDLTVSKDGKLICGVGSDKKIREITNSTVRIEVDSPGVPFTTISMSDSGKLLYCGTSSGLLMNVKFPLVVNPEYTIWSGHCKAVTRIRQTYDGSCVITTSEDGTVIVWKVEMAESKKTMMVYSDEILITKSDLEDKNSTIFDLQTRVDELKMENEYQLRLKDMSYGEKIKELTDKFSTEIENLKTDYLKSSTEKESIENRFKDLISVNEDKHVSEIQNINDSHSHKLLLEYEKYQSLQLKSQKMQENYENDLYLKDVDKENALKQNDEFNEAKLEDVYRKLEKAEGMIISQQTEHEEMRNQIEEDADQEILELKNNYERKLRDEREINHKLKSESGIMKKKFTSLTSEIDDLKDEIKILHNENSKQSNVIRNLERDILSFKKEVEERDDVIQDKEKKIYDIKKKNQELEKFKFVLDYKIKELKKQIEPKENYIKAMKEQIQEMERELEDSNKLNSQLDLNSVSLNDKLKMTQKEMLKERQFVRDKEFIIRKFQTDLHRCIAYIQDPKELKARVKFIYKKHAHGNILEVATLDSDLQNEYNRQREHLEKTVHSLRKKLVKDVQLNRADHVKIIQENVCLIKEINDLRKELKLALTQIHDLEVALGIHRNQQNKDSATTLAMIASTTKNAVLEKNLIEAKRQIDLQYNEITVRITAPQVSQATNLPPIKSE